MEAVICPICLGCGIVEIKDSEFTFYNKKCHGCNGKGWIRIYSEENNHSVNIEDLKSKEA